MYEIHTEVCVYSVLLKQLNQTSENLTVLLKDAFENLDFRSSFYMHVPSKYFGVLNFDSQTV
jgi:hypothetical protein